MIFHRRRHAAVFLGGLVATSQVSAGGDDYWIVRNSLGLGAPPTSTGCDKFVNCENGNEVDDEGTQTGDSCYDACAKLGGNCCTNSNSCTQFTGSVCADDGQKSCDGGAACFYARIGSEVINSCNGPSACDSMAFGGDVGPVTDSCKGKSACAYVANGGGAVGPMTGSCNAEYACNSMAKYRGTVGPMIGSCNAEYACNSMAIGPFRNFWIERGGVIGPVSYSCNAANACSFLPSNRWTGPFQRIAFMNGSCNTESGCKNYLGDADGSGLTCTANATAQVIFSPDTFECFDTDSGEVSTCEGSSDVCTSLCPAGDAYIPTNYWVPPLDKPGITCEAVRLKIPDHGEFSCIPIGAGICRDNGGAFGEWRFGIEEVETPPCEVTSKCRIDTATNTFPVLIDPANTHYPITGTTYTNSGTGKVCKNGVDEAIRGCNYAGTTHICISENIESDPNRYSDERPYMFFYDEKSHQYLYQLVCDGIGEEGKLPELKMVNNEDLADATYVDYPVDIVKFKKGATPDKDDANELWKMYVDWNGFEDPETRRIGKLASFIGVAHPKLCKEYVSATDKPCWKENCDDATPPIETPEDYEVSNCDDI